MLIPLYSNCYAAMFQPTMGPSLGSTDTFLRQGQQYLYLDAYFVDPADEMYQ